MTADFEQSSRGNVDETKNEWIHPRPEEQKQISTLLDHLLGIKEPSKTQVEYSIDRSSPSYPVIHLRKTGSPDNPGITISKAMAPAADAVEERPTFPTDFMSHIIEETQEELDLFFRNRAIDDQVAHLVDSLLYLEIFISTKPETFIPEGLEGYNREIQEVISQLSWGLNWLVEHRVPNQVERDRYDQIFTRFAKKR